MFPFLPACEPVARVDLKADRKAALRVPGAFAEPHAERPRVTAELHVMAEWVGLDGVVVGERGDPAARLAAAMRQGAGAVSVSGVSGSVGG